MSSAISVKKVFKYFGNFAALRSVDLEAPAGSVLALLGRNGAGKTTMLDIRGRGAKKIGAPISADESPFEAIVGSATSRLAPLGIGTSPWSHRRMSRSTRRESSRRESSSLKIQSCVVVSAAGADASL